MHKWGDRGLYEGKDADTTQKVDIRRGFEWSMRKWEGQSDNPFPMKITRGIPMANWAAVDYAEVPKEEI